MPVQDYIPWKRRTPTPLKGERPCPGRALRTKLAQLDFDWNRVRTRFYGQFGIIRPEQVEPMLAHTRPDIIEHGDKVEIVLDVPGFSEKDLDVSVDHGVLMVHGERSGGPDACAEKCCVRQERACGKLARHVDLPEGVDVDDADATVRNGVLRVVFAKAAPAGGATKIKVKAAE